MTRIPPVPIPPAQNQRLGVFSESARRRKRVRQHDVRFCRPRCDATNTPIFFGTFLGEESFVVDAKKGLQREIRDDAEANERRFLRRGCGTRERKLEQQQKHFEQQQNAHRYG